MTVVLSFLTGLTDCLLICLTAGCGLILVLGPGPLSLPVDHDLVLLLQLGHFAWNTLRWNLSNDCGAEFSNWSYRLSTNLSPCWPQPGFDVTARPTLPEIHLPFYLIRLRGLLERGFSRITKLWNTLIQVLSSHDLSIPLVLKCAAKTLKIGLQIKI